MRYLKVFEKSDKNIIDKDYIEMCFIEFMDDYNFLLNMNYDGTYCEIIIKYNLRTPAHRISNFIQDLKLRMGMLDKVNNCLAKVKIQYKNMKHNINQPTNNKISLLLALDTSNTVIRNPKSWFPI